MAAVAQRLAAVDPARMRSPYMPSVFSAEERLPSLAVLARDAGRQRQKLITWTAEIASITHDFILLPAESIRRDLPFDPVDPVSIDQTFQEHFS